MPSTSVTVTVPWNIGPDERECTIEVKMYASERPSWSEWDGGSPGSPAEAEITGYIKVIGIDGKRRNPTDEELEWITEDEEQIEERAFELFYEDEGRY